MKHSFKIAASAVLVLVMALLFTGCRNWEDPMANSSSGGVVKALWGGHRGRHPGASTSTLRDRWGNNPGPVTVWSDNDSLYVEYSLTGGWFMTECHVAVDTSLGCIPQHNGCPSPGRFPYSCSCNPPVQDDTCRFPLPGNCGDTLFIAAHCVACRCDWRGRIIERETCWAGDHNFPCRDLSKYFCCRRKKILSLPPDSVTMVPSTSANSYFQATLSNVATGYDVTNGTYTAWCVDGYDYIYFDHTYHPTLMSSYDDNLPTYAQSPDWDKINYIINHKQGTADDIQAAILYFKGGGDMPTSAYGIAMVDSALANGQDFYPGHGDMLAVLCLIPVDQYVQLTFIEVDP